MDTYFVKGFISNTYLGITGTHEVIEHFKRDNQSIERLIYIIVKACKSIEDWTISARLGDIKSPFKYGLSEKDIQKLDFDTQIRILQYYSNVYVLLFHICKSTQNILDAEYKEHIDLHQLQGRGGEVIGYIEEVNRRIMDKWNRAIL